MKLNEGRWKVAMAEPVLQGAIIKGETRLLVLPPSGEDDDHEEADKSATSQDHSRRTSQSSQEDDSQDEDFEIDESFLANSVLTTHHNNRFGQTPLTSPLSTSSRQKQFFPLGELSSGTPPVTRQSHLTPIPLSYPVSSQLLTPTPELDEDDVPRAFLSTIDLGRIGLFSGDWAVLRKNEGEEGGRLVRVFAADGLIDNGETVSIGLVTYPLDEISYLSLIHGFRSDSSIAIHLPPPFLHNLLGPSPSPDSSISIEAAPSVSSILSPQLPTASSLTLARIASPHSVNKLYQPLFLEGLKDYFQNQRRVVKKGDVIAIGIEEGRVRFTATSGNDGKEETEEFE